LGGNINIGVANEDLVAIDHLPWSD